MKKFYVSLLLGAMLLGSCKNKDEVKLLSNQERAIIDEMNYARTKPQEYAEKNFKKEYDEMKASGKDDEALRTAYETLMSTKPMGAVVAEPGLVLATRDHIANPKRNSAHGSEQGENLANSFAIANAYYKESGFANAEIVWDYMTDDCKYAYGTESHVKGWIRDNGNKASDWGHRKAILAPKATKVGVAEGKRGNTKYSGGSNGYSVVGVFADSFETKQKYKDDYGTKPAEVNWTSDHQPPKCPVK